jgi:hypothetical protein
MPCSTVLVFGLLAAGPDTFRSSMVTKTSEPLKSELACTRHAVHRGHARSNRNVSSPPSQRHEAYLEFKLYGIETIQERAAHGEPDALRKRVGVRRHA